MNPDLQFTIDAPTDDPTAFQFLVDFDQVESVVIEYYDNVNSDPVKSESKNTGDTLTVSDSSIVTRADYYFVEWNTEKDGSGTSYAPGDEIYLTDDEELYAQWTNITYSITYETNGGTLAAGKSNPEAYINDSELTYPTESEITRSGYKFAGWYPNSDFSGERQYSKAAGVKENIILYAKWLQQYTIIYNLNGGTMDHDSTETYTVQDAVTYPTDVTKSGATFIGWYDNSSFSGEPVYSQPAGTTGNKTLYAKWQEPHKVNVYYNSYGTVTANGETIESGSSVLLDAGETVTLVFTVTAENCSVYNVTINGARQGAIDSCTIGPIDADTTVVCTFARTTITPATDPSVTAAYDTLVEYRDAYLAGETMPNYEEISSITASDLIDYEPSTSGTLPEGLTYEGATLTIDNSFKLRFVFCLNSGDISNYTFKIGSTVITPEQQGKFYIVEQSGITVSSLGSYYKINVTDGTNSYTMYYSPLGYAYKAIAESGDPNLALVGKALYNYYEAYVEAAG